MAACLLHERWSSGNLVRPEKAILNFTCQGPGAKALDRPQGCTVFAEFFIIKWI